MQQMREEAVRYGSWTILAAASLFMASGPAAAVEEELFTAGHWTAVRLVSPLGDGHPSCFVRYRGSEVENLSYSLRDSYVLMKAPREVAQEAYILERVSKDTSSTIEMRIELRVSIDATSAWQVLTRPRPCGASYLEEPNARDCRVLEMPVPAAHVPELATGGVWRIGLTTYNVTPSCGRGDTGEACIGERFARQYEVPLDGFGAALAVASDACGLPGVSDHLLSPEQADSDVAPTLTEPYQQTFESCAATAFAIFGYLSDYWAGVPLQKLVEGNPYPENARGTYRLVEEAGLETAYLVAHAHYRECAREVDQRIRIADEILPESDHESRYRICGRASAFRFIVLNAIKDGQQISDLLLKLPPEQHGMVQALYETVEEGSLLKALILSADTHQDCVAAVLSR